MEGFRCELEKVQPVAEWMQEYEEGDEPCRPCMIAPLASFYVGVLKKAGEEERANQLTKVYEEGQGLTICEELDRIKSEVGDSVRKELVELDCFAQSYKPQD